MSEIVKVGKWDVPKKLYDDYVKFRIMADSYLDEKSETPSGTSYERAMRWNLTVQQVMKTHRDICAAIGIPYSEDWDDEFYKEFHKKVNEDTRLKG